MEREDRWQRILGEMFDPHRMARLAVAIGGAALFVLVVAEVAGALTSDRSWGTTVLRVLLGLVILSPVLLVLRNLSKGRYRREES
jgi:hypothetical protein